MCTPHPTRGPTPVVRGAGFAALALLLLAGTFELHPAEEAASPLAGPQLYFPDAAHPGQPAHLETSAAVERPHCAACLNRLQSRAAGLPSPLAQAGPPAATRLRGAAAWAPRETARPSVRGRAPPRS